MAKNIQVSLKQAASEFVIYLIAVNATTDITNTAKLAIFVCGIIIDFSMRRLACFKIDTCDYHR